LLDELDRLEPEKLRALLTEAFGALASGGLLVVRSASARYALSDVHALARAIGFRIAAAGMESSDAATWYLVGRRDPSTGGVAKSDGSII